MPIAKPMADFLKAHKDIWPELKELPHKNDKNLKITSILELISLGQEKGVLSINQSADDSAHKIIRAIRELHSLETETKNAKEIKDTPVKKIDPYMPEAQPLANKTKVLKHAAPGLWYHDKTGRKPEKAIAKDDAAKALNNETSANDQEKNPST